MRRWVLLIVAVAAVIVIVAGGLFSSAFPDGVNPAAIPTKSSVSLPSNTLICSLTYPLHLGKVDSTEWIPTSTKATAGPYK